MITPNRTIARYGTQPRLGGPPSHVLTTNHPSGLIIRILATRSVLKAGLVEAV
jgi:hypothetical protein